MPPPLQVDNIFVFIRYRWHLFQYVGYLRHEQQVDLWPFDLESGVQARCDVGYLCANFGLPIGLSVLELRPMYATDVRQMSDRRQTKASLNASAISGRRRNKWILIIISCLECWRISVMVTVATEHGTKCLDMSVNHIKQCVWMSFADSLVNFVRFYYFYFA